MHTLDHQHNITSLFLHYLSVSSAKQGSGYGSMMLKWIGDLYNDKPKLIYTVIKNDNVEFFENRGFKANDKPNTKFIIENVNMVANDSTLYCVNTCVFQDIETTCGDVYKSHIDPNVITKICLCKQGTLMPWDSKSDFKPLDLKQKTNTVNGLNSNKLFWLTEEEKKHLIVWYGFNPHFGWKHIL